MKDRNVYWTIAIGLVFTGFFFWSIIFVVLDTFFYESIKVDTFDCKILHRVDLNACDIINQKNHNVWFIEPCIFPANETNTRCVLTHQNHLPVPASYYEGQLGTYKFANFYIVLIVPLLIAITYTCMFYDEIKDHFSRPREYSAL